ncbi:uncharacterized protein LOC131944119 [Physella acuta]|uniref:uncharacterized protein LOC131944119 n=1 Tax=Physella acuta TaxID=109671 RepID=UPI0027DD7D8F|nr:uncharacterized protein LOC131944119 [Physella acuta]XP_059160613.1 uncharacterized protein LOC131944119 [Physella acuta]
MKRSNRVLSLILTVLYLITRSGSNQDVNCSKNFENHHLLITCISNEDVKGCNAKFVLQYQEDKENMAPSVSCQSIDATTLLCQQRVHLRILGIGKYHTYATIYPADQDCFVNQSIKLPISIDYPKITLENCSLNESEEFLAQCTCKRVDEAEIETWITLLINDVPQLKTSNSSLHTEFHIEESAEVECKAENIIGWKSNSANVKFSRRQNNENCLGNLVTQIMYTFLAPLLILFATVLYIDKVFSHAEIVGNPPLEVKAYIVNPNGYQCCHYYAF